MTTFSHLRERIELAIAAIDPMLRMPDHPTVSIRDFYRVEWHGALKEVPRAYREAFVESLLGEASSLNELYRPLQCGPDQRPDAKVATRALLGADLPYDRRIAALGGSMPETTPDWLFTILPNSGFENDSVTSTYLLDGHELLSLPQMSFDLSKASSVSATRGESKTSNLAVISTSRRTNFAITVLGLGGAGCFVADRIAEVGLRMQTIVAHTDRDALARCKADVRLQLGTFLAQNAGLLPDPKIGRWAAEQRKHTFRQALEGSDFLFIASDLGTGIGSGATPVIARIARDMEIATIAIVSSPLPNETKFKISVAKRCVRELQDVAHCVMVVSHSKAPLVTRRGVTLSSLEHRNVERALDEALRGASYLTNAGLFNSDVSELQAALLSQPGTSKIGVGFGTGSDRAKIAVERAFGVARIRDGTPGEFGYVSVVACERSITRWELKQVRDTAQGLANGAEVSCGAVFDNSSNGTLRVTVIATPKARLGRFDQRLSA